MENHLHGTNFFLRLFLFLGMLVACAGAPAYGQSAAKITGNTVQYLVISQDCNFQLNSTDGGKIFWEAVAPLFSTYSDKYVSPHAHRMSATFKCKLEDSEKFCSGEWSDLISEGDPSTIKLMGVRFYKDINALYGGIAYSSRQVAVNPPVDRDLDFCLGDSSRTLTGTIRLGSDTNPHTAQALGLIASLRFVDK